MIAEAQALGDMERKLQKALPNLRATQRPLSCISP
jgi:hypothetical protein